MCIYSPMPHTLSYCALIGRCALIRSNTVSAKKCKAELANSLELDKAALNELPHLNQTLFALLGTSLEFST